MVLGRSGWCPRFGRAAGAPLASWITSNTRAVPEKTDSAVANRRECTELSALGSNTQHKEQK